MEYKQKKYITTIPHTKYIEILVKNIKYPSIVVDHRLGLKYYSKTFDSEGVILEYIFLVKDQVKLSLAKLEYEF